MRCTGHRTTGAGTLPTGADTTFEAVARAGPVPCRRDTECCRRDTECCRRDTECCRRDAECCRRDAECCRKDAECCRRDAECCRRDAECCRRDAECCRRDTECCRRDTECAPGWPRRRGQIPQGRRLRHAGCTIRPGRSGGPSTMARPPRSRPRDNGGCALGRQDGIGQAHEALRRPARAMVGWATMDDSADAGRWAQGPVLVGGLPLRWSAAPCLATERPVRSAIPADVACSWRTGDAAVESGGAEGHVHPSRRRTMSTFRLPRSLLKHRCVAHPATACAHEVSRGKGTGARWPNVSARYDVSRRERARPSPARPGTARSNAAGTGR